MGRTAERHSSAETRRVVAFGAAAWCLVFLIPHGYWGLGGRAGLGDSSRAADQAFEQAWFTLYNGAVIVLCVLGAAWALLLATPRLLDRPSGLLRLVALTAGVLLLLRGGVGLAALAVDVVSGDALPPLILGLVEPAFVLGGLIWLALGRTIASARERTPSPGR
ncbi:DUF3995 domain-containing protein [Nocardioides pantholopis]|uniref:DUF3995 domain-containing protein n=1 Tax=Nocardioides pantholopis TaxID=2483798 RepID=UPI0013DE2766|nr:DUF3995 domain-containing protein [Nocardioides pantholopis]